MASWEKLFQLGGVGANDSLDEDVDPTCMHDCDNKLTQFVLQLYSMETFI